MATPADLTCHTTLGYIVNVYTARCMNIYYVTQTHLTLNFKESLDSNIFSSQMIKWVN